MSASSGNNSQIDPFAGENDNSTNSGKKFRIVRNYNSSRRLNGLYEEYDSEGRLVRKCHYVDNKLDGSCMIKIFDGENLAQIIKTFYVDGKLMGPYETKKLRVGSMTTVVKANYRDGGLNGFYEERDYNNLGTMILFLSREYVDDTLHGSFREVGSEFVREGTYIDGLLEGIVTTFMKKSNLQKYTLLYRSGQFDRVVDAQDKNNRSMLLEGGTVIVWKAGKHIVGSSFVVVYVKLEVLIETKRTVLIPETDYHRVAKASVLEIFDKMGNHYSSCISLIQTDTPIVYTVGNTVTEVNFDDDIFNKTGAGIYVYKYKDLADQWF